MHTWKGERIQYSDTGIGHYRSRKTEEIVDGFSKVGAHKNQMLKLLVKELTARFISMQSQFHCTTTFHILHEDLSFHLKNQNHKILKRQNETLEKSNHLSHRGEIKH